MIRYFEKKDGTKILQEGDTNDPNDHAAFKEPPTIKEQITQPEPPPIVVVSNPKVYDKGLTSDKVTSDYGQRLIVDTQAEYNELMKDSGGWLKFQNHGGLWINNVKNIIIPRLDAENAWVLLFTNFEKVVIESLNTTKMRVGPQFGDGIKFPNATGHVEIGTCTSSDNYRPQEIASQPQGDGILFDSRLLTFLIKKLITEKMGDGGIDNKAIGKILSWDSTMDGNACKCWNTLEIVDAIIKDCGRLRNERGEGVQARASGGNARLVLSGKIEISNCKKPAESIKSAVVTSGKTAITEITGQITVRRPTGYKGSVFMEVNGGDIPQSSRDKVIII